MPVTVTRLTPCFATRVDGADMTQPPDDAPQIPFSRRFGGIEVTRSNNPAAGTPFARQSNLDIRTGEVIPPESGATEFAGRRAAYPSLPEALKRRAEAAIAIHDVAWSRDQVRPGEPPPQHPRLPHRGLPVDEGRAFTRELQTNVTQPQFGYRHEGQEGDLVVWDNRCVLHRATPYDTTR